MNDMRILAAVLSFAYIAPGASAAESDPLSWVADIEPGWQFLMAGGPPWSATFIRPDFVVGADGHRTGWVRVEHKEPRPAVSGAIRFEVDCGGNRFRALEAVYYSERELKGRLIERRLATDDWRTNPTHDIFVPYVCADTPAQRENVLHRSYGVLDWARRPSADDLMKVYPAAARAKRIEGRALLDCEVTPVGHTRDCRVAQESPAGEGFGQAALQLTHLFALRRVHPSSASPYRMNIPIRFALPKP